MGEAAATCDVLVIGGGPAGSTAAATLAQRGLDVVLLEKDAHPRFHIGESLLPRNLAILDRLGVTAEVAALGTFKPGAEFVADDTGRRTTFNFAEAIDPGHRHAYQVPRAEFDAALFANARRHGARAWENTKVTDLTLGQDGGRATVRATGPEGARTWAPRYVLDASGRDTFLAGRLKLKDSNKHNSTAAMYAHFRGIERRTGDVEGYITVHLAQDGWFWMIPLPGDVMSVGFVGNQSAFKGRRGSASELYADRLATSPTVRARMQHAEMLGEVTSTANYSYRARSNGGDGYMMIGDAFAFVDPMFSSGVLMAMTAGERSADIVAAWLEDPARGVAMARRMERHLCRMMDNLGWFIYRINDPVLRHMFLNPTKKFRMREGVISLLAGNLGRDWRTVVPVLAFKTAYYGLHGLRRLGLGPLSEPTPAPVLAAAE